jgi:hypothetical protein
MVYQITLLTEINILNIEITIIYYGVNHYSHKNNSQLSL